MRWGRTRGPIRHTLLAFAGPALIALAVTLVTFADLRAHAEGPAGAPPSCAEPMALQSPFAGAYSCFDLGSVSGLPTNYGGLTFKLNDPNTIIIGGAANTANGALYSIPVIRDQNQHITGFSGQVTFFAAGAYNDGGIVYGPGDVLFLARWPTNELGETKPGSSATDLIVSLSPFNNCGSDSALNFVPNGFPGAGKLKLVTYGDGCWYTASIQPDGNGTYSVTQLIRGGGQSGPLSIVGGPEGFIYVPPGSPNFADYNSMLVSEYGAGNIAAYQLDSNGDPDPATRTTFLSGLSGAEGAVIDPVTGDFLFSTFGGANHVVRVSGFAAPATATPPATTVAGPTATSTLSPTATSTALPTVTSTAVQAATPTLSPTATQPAPATPTPSATTAPAPTPTPAAAPVVRVGSFSGNVGDGSSVSVQALDIGPPGLGAWTIDVLYDPQVLSVTSCSALHGGVCNATFRDDTVLIAGTSASGMTGDVGLGSVGFRCIGPGTSSLLVVVEVLADATPDAPQNINAGVENGSAVCHQAPATATATTTRPPTTTRTSRPPDTSTPAPQPTDTPVPPLPSDTPTPFFVLLPPSTSTPVPPTATLTPASTHTAAPTATATLSSEVAGAEHPSPAPPGGSGANVSGPIVAGGAVPRTSAAILSPDNLNTNPKVVATNFFLALILLLVLLFTSTLFNGVLDENREAIDRLGARIVAPFRGLRTGIGRAMGGSNTFMQVLAGPALLLGIIGLIYSFNDPNWGFNQHTLVLFLSVIIAVGIVTLIMEGGEAFMHRRRHRLDAGVRMYPVAIAIAIGFVLLSRLVNFEAPIMYGFVAAAAILVPATLDRRQAGLAIFVPASILLLLSLGAWGLMIPLGDYTRDHSEWWGVLPWAVAGILFASGIEGLVFSMIPLQFLDGRKILRWNWLAWTALFGVPAFLFCWVILNPEAKSFDALIEGRVLTAIGLVGAYAIATMALWSFFLLRHRQAETHAAAGALP